MADNILHPVDSSNNRETSNSQAAESSLHNEAQSAQKAELLAKVNIDPQALLKVFDDNVDKLDADGNGFVTHEETAKLGRGSGFEEQILRGFDLFGKELEEVNDDEFGDENSGFTRKDIEALAHVDNLTNQSNVDLVNRIGFMGTRNLYGLSQIESAFGQHKEKIWESYEDAGRFGGAFVGVVGGALAADATGLLLAPLVPIGLIAGTHYGGKLGRSFGQFRASLVDRDDFVRSYIDEQLERGDR